MVRIIRTHNKLNGLAFSIAEFVFITAIIVPFAIYYILHARILYALVAVGIIMNCLTVAALGVRQWVDKEQGIGWKRFRNKQERARIERENPHLFKDTLILTITALAPYVLIVLVSFELLTHSGSRNS